MRPSGHIPARTRIFLGFTMMVLVFILSSCSSSRRMIREPLMEEGSDYLLQRLKDNQTRFETFSARFNATYHQNKTQSSFKGQVRIRRDSIIWITLSPALGIEMMRIIITNDSLKMIDRISSVSLAADYQYFYRLLNRDLDFDMLQALIVGNDFSTVEQGSFQASVDHREYKLVSSDRKIIRKDGQGRETPIIIPVQHIWLEPVNFKISRILLKETMDESSRFVAWYSDFEWTNGQLLPGVVRYAIQAPSGRLEVSLRYSRISLDEPLSFPFHVPDKYTKLQ